MHLQFFGQNRVARTFTDAYFFGNFTDSLATILTNHSTHFLDVDGRPALGSSSMDVLPDLKRWYHS
jgi:hypothetical protein